MKPASLFPAMDDLCMILLHRFGEEAIKLHRTKGYGSDTLQRGTLGEYSEQAIFSLG